jgi:hypothetical protein
MVLDIFAFERGHLEGFLVSGHHELPVFARVRHLDPEARL